MDKANYEFVGDLYQLFQLRAEAPRILFDAVYRVMMKDLRAHPDVGGGEDLAKRLNLAIAIIRDAGERVRYDEWYRARFGGAQPPVVRRDANSPLEAEEASIEERLTSSRAWDFESLMKATYWFLKSTRRE